MLSTGPESDSLIPDYGDYMHVAVAVIDNGKGEVLLAKRPQHLHQGGLWEFPGGKLESTESAQTALQRELGEELGIELLQAHPLIRIPHSYPDRKVLLDVWHVTHWHGEPEGREGQQLRWVSKGRLHDYSFPQANRPIVKAAQLPACYLISPEPGGEAEWPDFLQQLRHALQGGVTMMQLRAPALERESYLQLAREVSGCCKEFGVELLLNGGVSLLDECEADGIHLNSRRMMALRQRCVAEEKLLAASCHNFEELQQAQRIDVDFALLSPVKATASHPGAEAMGWDGFHYQSERCSIPLYALGGMSPHDLDDAWDNGAQGIAAIRSLWEGGNRCAE